MFKNALSHAVTAVSALGLTVAMTVPAFAAGTELSDALTASVDTTQLLTIGGVVMTIAGIILLIRSGRKSSGG